MTVVFIKVECPRHPGHWTMGEPCDFCIQESFRKRMDEIFDDFRKELRKVWAD